MTYTFYLLQHDGKLHKEYKFDRVSLDSAITRIMALNKFKGTYTTAGRNIGYIRLADGIHWADWKVTRG